MSYSLLWIFLDFHKTLLKAASGCLPSRNVSTSRKRGIALCHLRRSLANSEGFDDKQLKIYEFNIIIKGNKKNNELLADHPLTCSRSIQKYHFKPALMSCPYSLNHHLMPTSTICTYLVFYRP
jgi:hypothetical protein